MANTKKIESINEIKVGDCICGDDNTWTVRNIENLPVGDEVYDGYITLYNGRDFKSIWASDLIHFTKQ